MGILSRRWRDLWVSMPYLSFSDREFYHGNGMDGWWKFQPFVDTVLLLRHTSDVHTFHLLLKEGFDHHSIYTWVQYAVRHNVKVLTINVEKDGEYVDLPRCCFFSCQSIEELSLASSNGGMRMDPPMLTCFGRLRRLHLEHIVFYNASLEKLISGCPVLEDLHLAECSLQNVNIASHTLKKLSIRNCTVDGTGIQISLPSLLSFDFFDNKVGKRKILLENLSSLVDASLQTDDGNVNDAKPLKFISSRVEFEEQDEEEEEEEEEGEEEEEEEIQMFEEGDEEEEDEEEIQIIEGGGGGGGGGGGIDDEEEEEDVEEDDDDGEVVPYTHRISEKVESSNLPVFHNLKRLILGGRCMSNILQAVTHFLHRSPNLEMLTLKGQELRLHPLTEKEEAIRSSEELWFDCFHLKILIQVECGLENERGIEILGVELHRNCNCLKE